MLTQICFCHCRPDMKMAGFVDDHAGLLTRGLVRRASGTR